MVPRFAGEMAEWLKAHAWKACLLERVTWVRIPLSPPAILNCREIPPAFPSKYAKDAHFSRFFLSKPDCGARTARQRGRDFPGFSLEGTRAVRFRGGH